MAGLNNDKQTVKVSEEVVSMIAAKAALRVPGVSRLSGEFADKVTRTCYPWVTTAYGYKAAFVAAYSHGAEFEYPEILVVPTHSHLTIKHRTIGV